MNIGLWHFVAALVAVYLAGGASGFLLQRWVIGAKTLKALSGALNEMNTEVQDMVQRRNSESDALDKVVSMAGALNERTGAVNDYMRRSEKLRKAH